jgi:hypothetical protein
MRPATAHFVAGQAGPKEEFVIVKWVYGITGRIAGWVQRGAVRRLSSPGTYMTKMIEKDVENRKNW